MEHLPALFLYAVVSVAAFSMVWALVIPRQHLRQEAPYFGVTVFGVFVLEALLIAVPLMLSQSHQEPLESVHLGYMAYIPAALAFAVLLIMGGKRSGQKVKGAGQKAVYAGWFAGLLAVFCGLALMVQLLAHVS